MSNSLITEGIVFDTFNSIEQGFYLIERHAPSPKEKEILEDIPFMQGVHDFSMILGERIFDNRDIKYILKKYGVAYSQRKVIENDVKDKLLSVGENVIIDTHETGFQWLGKCTDVDVDDSEENHTLTVTATFSCYPFLLTSNNYYDDVWDTINFEKDVLCFSKYVVSERKTILLVNNGSTAISPIIYTDSTLVVNMDNQVYTVQPGYTENIFMKVAKGVNKVTVEGSGVIVFYMRKEVMA